MFGSSSKRAPSVDQVETIVGQNTHFVGTINAGGTIRVDGKIDGELITKGDVVVGETGQLKAHIKTRNLTLAGTVHGNVDVVDKLELASSGRLFGDIKTGTLIIGEGAMFKGACEMHQEKAADAKTEAAKGDIPKDAKLSAAKS